MFFGAIVYREWGGCFELQRVCMLRYLSPLTIVFTNYNVSTAWDTYLLTIYVPSRSLPVPSYPALSLRQTTCVFSLEDMNKPPSAPFSFHTIHRKAHNYPVPPSIPPATYHTSPNGAKRTP